MNEYTSVTLRQKPELKVEAAAWLHDKWGVPLEAYLECIEAYLNTENYNIYSGCLVVNCTGKGKMYLYDLVDIKKKRVTHSGLAGSQWYKTASLCT